MLANNPMHNPETIAKVRAFYNSHPEAARKRLERLTIAKQKVQKGKPTKLELRLFAILEDIDVAFKRFPLIKPKFIVDCMIGDLIIQADGDYWHGHPRFYPLTDRQLAQQKRDKAQDIYLHSRGYTVERIWECEMSEEVVRRVLARHDIILSAPAGALA